MRLHQNEVLKGDIPIIFDKSLCNAFDSNIKINQFNGSLEKDIKKTCWKS